MIKCITILNLIKNTHVILITHLKSFGRKTWYSTDAGIWVARMPRERTAYTNRVSQEETVQQLSAVRVTRYTRICSTRFLEIGQFHVFFVNVLIFWDILCAFWIYLLFLKHFQLNLWKRYLFYNKELRCKTLWRYFSTLEPVV